MSSNIAIIGAGNLVSGLAKPLIKATHRAMMGARFPLFEISIVLARF